jgi:uncharacterized Zn finger protein
MKKGNDWLLKCKECGGTKWETTKTPHPTNENHLIIKSECMDCGHIFEREVPKLNKVHKPHISVITASSKNFKEKNN